MKASSTPVRPAAEGAPAPPAGRAYAIWAVGVAAYILAVMQRTSLGVAGLDAAERFGVTPAALSGFVFVQVCVYMAAQLPAGVLVDRVGSRVALVVSGSLLATGQLLLALATSLPLAVAGRVLVGVGDAIVFVAVLALIPRWFPPRRVPLFTQLTTILCQLGQVLSAVPFVALLRAAGWTPAFATAAAAGALVTLAALAVVRTAPPGTWAPPPAASARDVLLRLREVWSRPGTKLGFFGHMATQFSMNVFTLLWGVPYLVSGQGLSPQTAGLLVTLFVLCTIVIGPVFGAVVTRRPLQRSRLLLAVVGVTALAWTAVLALPGRAPLWLLVLLVVVLAAGGPASVVGIDIARTTNPDTQLGLAQSMVNLGGFSASLVVLVAMGAVMNALGGFTAEAFRVAWLVQYPVWAFAVACAVVMRRRARRAAAVGSEPDET